MPKKLVAAMICHNEADRYLDLILENTSKFADEIIVLDHSDDGSDKIYAKYPKVKVFTSETTWQDGEKLLREELNDYIIKNCNPDWIIGIDADDLYDTTYEEMHQLMDTEEYSWYGFQWLDMFNDMEHYKINCSTKAPRMYKVSAVSEYDYGVSKYHVFQVPLNILYNLPGIYTDIKIKHLGYYQPKDRQHHYHNYQIRTDPNNQYGTKEAYMKILSETPEIFEVSKYVNGGEK